MSHEMFIARCRPFIRTICGLQSGCNYRCSVAAKNSAGKSLEDANKSVWTEPTSEYLCLFLVTLKREDNSHLLHFYR